MTQSAGETVSIRVPPGTKEELKAATGLPFSTVVRRIVMVVLADYRRRRKENEASIVAEAAKANIELIAQAELAKGAADD